MSDSSSTLVAVAGASGNLAQRIIRRLLEVPNITVRGFARTPAKIEESIRLHKRFSVVQGQVDDLKKIRDALQGASVVICAYQGYEDVMYLGQCYLIDACEELGINRYFASDFTFNYNKLELGQHEGKDCMIKVKQYLADKKVKAVFILIGCFLETFLGYMKIWDPAKNTFSYWGTGDEPWDLTTFDDTASYTVKLVLDPTAVGTFNFRGDKKSTREIAQIYEDVYNIKPELKSRGSVDLLYTFMHAEKQKYVGQNKWLYMTWFYQYYELNGQGLLDEPIDNGSFPEVKPHDVVSFFRAHDVTSPEHLISPI